MTADVDLLPLPSVLLNWPHPTNHAGIRDYARANVSHATAPLQAEIEELREALDWTVQQNDELLNEGRELTARAERLAEAVKAKLHDWYARDRLDESDVQWMREKTYEQCADELTALLRDHEEGM